MIRRYYKYWNKVTNRYDKDSEDIALTQGYGNPISDISTFNK